jgi:predicted DsbA family dithiol-disulfide isomerase
MFFALGQGVDIWDYHARMYKAALIDRVDIEDINVLAESVRGLLDTDTFRKSLQNGEYAEVQQDANRYAYEKSGVWAVPSYRMNCRKLDSVENIGVTKEQLAVFMGTVKQV